MSDPENYNQATNVIEDALRDSERHRVIVFCILILSLLGVAGTYWFDQPKISFILGCFAFYWSVEAICGEIGRLGQKIALLQTVQTKEILQHSESARRS